MKISASRHKGNDGNMALQNPFSYPDLSPPNDAPPSTWLSDYAAIIAIGVILFSAILAGAIVLGYRHMETTTRTVLTGDIWDSSVLCQPATLYRCGQKQGD